MKASKIIARKFIFPTIIKTGLEKKWRNNNNNYILNILYHGVVSEDSSYFSPRHITKELFERHLKYFVKEFDIISLPEAFDIYRNKKTIKRKAITISFDDGYKNNLNIALPLLEKYNIKTTFFISSVLTKEMELRTLWADVIACLRFSYKNKNIEIGNYRFNNFIEESSNMSIENFLKTRDTDMRDELLELLIKKYNIQNLIKQLPNEIWEFLNKEEFQKLASSNIVDIGSHGNLHYNLGNIKIEDARNDMNISKKLLEGLIDKKIDMIAYPDGSYTQNVLDVASELGYDKQLAVDYRLKNDVDDKRLLPRLGVSSTTTYESNIFYINKAFQTKGF